MPYILIYIIFIFLLLKYRAMTRYKPSFVSYKRLLLMIQMMDSLLFTAKIYGCYNILTTKSRIAYFYL